jgi:ABC-2 type transport system permease protein
MKTMKWLIRREFWEHKGALLWAPLIGGALIVSLFFISVARHLMGSGISRNFTFNGNNIDSLVTMGNLTGDQITTLSFVFSNAFMAISAPFFVVLAFAVVSFCLNCLYEERRDRSILFWKSLPISDHATVLSKLTVATLIAPLVAIAVATVTALLILLMASVALAFKSFNVFGTLLSAPSLYLTPFQVVGLIPIFVLWGLPTFGWLLMVSSWARSKVMLWAFGLPVLSLGLLAWAEKMFSIDLNHAWFAHNIVARALLGVIPGAWVQLSGIQAIQFTGPDHFGIDMTEVFTQSWSLLGNSELWIGAVAGVAMIYVAIRMRRWREEG